MAWDKLGTMHILFNIFIEIYFVFITLNVTGIISSTILETVDNLISSNTTSSYYILNEAIMKETSSSKSLTITRLLNTSVTIINKLSKVLAILRSSYMIAIHHVATHLRARFYNIGQNTCDIDDMVILAYQHFEILEMEHTVSDMLLT